MKIDIMGIVQDNPTSKGKSTSFRLIGGGPFLYAYGNLGTEVLKNVNKNDVVVASGGISYNQNEAEGNWQKFINIDGGVSVLSNAKKREDEQSQIIFTMFGNINDITPKTTKKGEMAVFKIREKNISWRGENTFNHSVVAFGDVAKKVFEYEDGTPVIVKGEIKRVSGNNDQWYTSLRVTYVNEIQVSEERQAEPQESSSSINENDIPF